MTQKRKQVWTTRQFGSLSHIMLAAAGFRAEFTLVVKTIHSTSYTKG
jgi:hypothetical protein